MQKQDKIINQVCIAYATETGNAYQIALRSCYTFMGKVHQFCELNEQFQFMPNNLYVLIVSTTGQGDPPYSMRQFWKMIMSKSYPNLKDVKFCIYGLGDRSYGDNFNITARKLRQRMLMLQAEEVVSIGLGDQQDENGCFHQYFTNFLPSLTAYIANCLINQSGSLDANYFYKLKLNRQKQNSKEYRIFKISNQKYANLNEEKNLFFVSLQAPVQQQKNIKLGDIIEILPQNSKKNVEQMQNYFQQKKLNDMELSEEDLTRYLRQIANLDNVLNFTFFYENPLWPSLGSFIQPSLDASIQQLFKQKLSQLGRDYDQYFNYIKRYRRNVREVITDFSLKIPLSVFMKRLGVIIPRKYSIAKFSIEGQMEKIDLLVKLQVYKVSSNRIIKGLCSHDLCLSPIQDMQACLRRCRILRNGEFQITSDFSNQLNIAMISLGTGIAPFLSVIDQVYQNKNNWHLYLFHSSRYMSQLPLLKEQKEKLQNEQKLDLYLTYTRQKEPTQNRRLQFIIENNLDVIKKCEYGKILICGRKQFCDFACRIFQEKIGFQVKKMKKSKIICIQNW